MDQEKSKLVPVIREIETKNLFHSFSYSLKAATSDAAESGKLILFYGDNGSGKTTVLNLLYHLLHPEPYGGHRSFLGTVPFQRFRVRLTNDALIEAVRVNSSDAGPYTIRVRLPNGRAMSSWRWTADRSSRRGADGQKYRAICKWLTGLGMNFHYLRDSRRLEGARERERIATNERTRGFLSDPFLVVERADEDELISPEQLLKQSIESAISWFRQQALSGTNVGYTSVHSIYRDLIQRIVTHGGSVREKFLTIVCNYGNVLILPQVHRRKL